MARGPTNVGKRATCSAPPANRARRRPGRATAETRENVAAHGEENEDHAHHHGPATAGLPNAPGGPMLEAPPTARGGPHANA
eukprot:10165803-Lingulodinium_polyedra.AAC.1